MLPAESMAIDGFWVTKRWRFIGANPSLSEVLAAWV